MALVVFYEKPGCATNARQKQMLADAGHMLEVRNLLTERWTAQSLLPFLVGQPVSLWFNRAAPRVKSGEVDPAACDAETALLLLLADPLLIRRPLMESGDSPGDWPGDWRCAGFDAVTVDRAIGLKLARDDEDEALEGCAHGESGRVCPPPA